MSTYMREIGLYFSCNVVWFLYQGNAGLIKWVGKCLAFIFLKSLCEIGIISSSNV